MSEAQSRLKDSENKISELAGTVENLTLENLRIKEELLQTHEVEKGQKAEDLDGNADSDPEIPV